MRQRLAAGNWKMNGIRASLAMLEELDREIGDTDSQVVICPPATLISAMAAAAQDTDMRVGAQNCHQEAAGAFTGDVSAEMLADAGAEFVILGHSERRSGYKESDACIRDKTSSVWAAGLTAIVCVGESLDERDASNTLDIIGGQLAGSIPDQATGQNLVVAYEPIWAIGTGHTPTLDQIGKVHDFIRARLERRFGEGVGRSVRILYGGSMNAKNAADIIAVSNVDGGLIGGASLKAEDFAKIVNAFG